MKIPIFSTSDTSYSVEDAVRIILQPNQSICTQQPNGCHISSTFVIDLSTLDEQDIKADDLGVWKNQGVRSTYCSIKCENEKIQKITVLGNNKPAVMRSFIYRLKRTYWIHTEDNRVSRRIFELEGKGVLVYS